MNARNSLDLGYTMNRVRYDLASWNLMVWSWILEEGVERKDVQLGRKCQDYLKNST